jgi:hypothetical protein
MFEEFKGLTGFAAREVEKPEEAFFHSVYISGMPRQNHLGIVEQPGKLQIRGVEYNLDRVSLIITNVKNVLVKMKTVGDREVLDCFSYQEGPPPWKGTSGRVCGKNSAERAAVEFCSTCRSHLIVAGLYTDANGVIIRDRETDKPFFIFIRARGSKYGKVADYLSELSRLDLPPIFEPVTEESREFEKRVANLSRFVTNVTVGKVTLQRGIHSAFDLSRGTELPKVAVIEVLKIAKKILPKFKEKFDWSLTKATSDYSQLDESHKFEEKADKEVKPEEKKASFEDIIKGIDF